MQPQTLFLCYAKNKYDRFAKGVDSELYDVSNTQYLKRSNFGSLFTINTSDRRYSLKMLKFEIFTLIKMFPEKTKYEKELKEDKNEKEIIKKIKEGKSNFDELSELINIKYHGSKYAGNREKKNGVLNYIIGIIIIILIIIICIIRKVKSSEKYNDFDSVEIIYETSKIRRR